MEMTDAQIIERGIQARQTLENGSIRAALQEILGEQTDTFTNTLPEQNFEREVAYFQQRAIQLLIQRLISWVQAGQILSDQIEQAR